MSATISKARAVALCTVLDILLFVSLPADAASIEVTNMAAHSGSYGLKVIPTTPCTSLDTVILSDYVVTAPEAFEACKKLSTASGFVVSDTGDATFTAGTAVIMNSGFRVDAGGALAVVIDPGLLPLAYVQDDTPNAETTYRAGFYVNLDNATFDLGDEIEHFVAHTADSTPQFKLLLRQQPGGLEVILVVREDNGNMTQTTAIPLSSGWSEISVDWEAASDATASLSINALPPVTLTGLNTQSARIDFVRWGAVGGSFSKTPGHFFQDDFVSTR
ncbi:MAG: hypothetical protein OES26_15690 [Gammaproteobacteria bacterium]|nr:hypothetical protein [Gammaproteobacteria bacterium]